MSDSFSDFTRDTTHSTTSAIRERFFGKPGEPVPTVAPDDIRAVWNLRREDDARFPDKGVILGMGSSRVFAKPEQT